MLIAGVDEVGRGPLAGPVIAAAVILNEKTIPDGIKDSKKLSEKKRDLLSEQIRQNCIAYAIGKASVAEIDKLNIHHASLLAMKRAIEGLEQQPDKVLVDGKYCPDLSIPSEAIIKGDSKVIEIGAASILAKVYRDRLMLKYAQKYPDYQFDKHKGYPTKLHVELLAKFGVLVIHRKSYAPVKKLLSCI